MITSADFEKIVMKYPKLDNRGKRIERLLGLDSEALTTGEPFLFCFDCGVSFKKEDIPQIFFHKKFIGKHISVYNLKYDSGAILYTLPDENKYELWEKTFTWIEYPIEQFAGTALKFKKGISTVKIKIDYIPHKFLGFSVGKKRVYIWDISQYFNMSLDRASEIYLGKRKIDIGSKEFTPAMVKRDYEQIKKYCIYDAVLCAELGTYLVEKLMEFGIRATALYSGASLSFRYFADRGKIVTSWHWYKYGYKDLLKFAMDSYEGGKFEVSGRGSAYLYEYDIVSAYPAEIRSLIDITFSRIVKDTAYHSEAAYGFIRCKISNPEGLCIPCGIMTKDNVRIYPAGEFFATITKNEYDYLTEIGIRPKIISAYWLFIDLINYPYRKTMDELFSLKKAYKNKDIMLYEVSKRMANSIYGKFCQLIENYKDEYVAGICFNPMYAAVITANVRIKMCRYQNLLKDNCLAVHTDSIITTVKMDDSLLGKNIGELSYETEGEGLIIGCGQYQIADKNATKGFERGPKDTWRSILERNKKAVKISYPTLRVNTWIDRVAKGKYTGINVFEKTQKIIDLNADTKRLWSRRATGKDLLGGIEYGLPIIIVDATRPIFWGRDTIVPEELDYHQKDGERGFYE